LQTIFSAASATLLVKEHNQLFLSATTDEKLRGAKVQYSPGQGFTGHVLKTGMPVHLFDATDSEEIRKNTGLTNRTVRKETEAVARTGKPFHFLAVPTFSSDPTGDPESTNYSGLTDHLNGVCQ